MNIKSEKRTRRFPSTHTRKGYIIESYRLLIKEGRIKEGSYAMNRWNYLKLNNFKLNS